MTGFCYSHASNNAWDIRQSQNKATEAYSMIQKEEPCLLPHWYPQSRLLALFRGCLYIPCSARCLSQTWIYVLAIRVSTGNYTSGVSPWSHLIWASQLISLHLSFSACETDNNVGTTQCGLIEVLASPWLRGLQRYDGFLISDKVKWYCLTCGYYSHWTISSLCTTLGFGGALSRTCCLLQLWAMGDPAENNSIGSLAQDASAHLFISFF